MKSRLILLMLRSPLLMAGSCSDDPGNPCLQPPPKIGGAVTIAHAADDPCVGQGKNHIVAWFKQNGTRYPLRCGVRDDARGRGGYGYVHTAMTRRRSTPPATATP